MHKIACTSVVLVRCSHAGSQCSPGHLGVSVGCTDLAGHRVNSQSGHAAHQKTGWTSDLLFEIGGWTPNNDPSPCFHYRQKFWLEKHDLSREVWSCLSMNVFCSGHERSCFLPCCNSLPQAVGKQSESFPK